MVSERRLAVLRAIVQDYVASREPVGSKTIVDRHSFGVSAATIRNDMALLEEEALIEAPHTSSGRIPTDKGYRLFVDRLADVRPLSPVQRHAIEAFLGGSADLDELLARTVRLMSQLTRQLAVVQVPLFGVSHVRHVELIDLGGGRLLVMLITDAGHVDQRIVDLAEPEATDDATVDAEALGRIRERLNRLLGGLEVRDAERALGADDDLGLPEHAGLIARVRASLAVQARGQRAEKLVVAGAANLVRTEQDFGGSILDILEAIEEQAVVLRLFGEMAEEQGGVTVSIGRENAPFGLGETSVVASSFAAPGRELARLGVLGPTRMDYSTNMAAVRAVARYLSRLLGDS
ncbi:heat-inducible transcriptional repressor HrcA [Agromyces archimandritae]|uniref:Heat-inducible transcription repressor HrcA n=1 Tax=Agromyces archimandritae TaxID=2781962 RepID=A0A975FMJ5_9MICO|nr:heat-inducible transcriptional repressor HrcA [Agromyces archimandritae]QTX04870.1 heat-inducible transcriptional repressor HrcA [Agromyces archimandritae]